MSSGGVFTSASSRDPPRPPIQGYLSEYLGTSNIFIVVGGLPTPGAVPVRVVLAHMDLRYSYPSRRYLCTFSISAVASVVLWGRVLVKVHSQYLRLRVLPWVPYVPVAAEFS